MQTRMLQFVYDIKCYGVRASSFISCIDNSSWTVCSSPKGFCGPNKTCVCNPGFGGQFCSEILPLSAGTSSSTAALGIGLALPLGLAALVTICCLLAGLLVWRKLGKEQDGWEVDLDELQIGELVGVGGYVSYLHNAQCGGNC